MKIKYYLINKYLYNDFELWKMHDIGYFNNSLILQRRRVSKALGGLYQAFSNFVVILMIFITGIISAPILSLISFTVIPLAYKLISIKYKPILNKLSKLLDKTDLNKIKIIKDSFYLRESILCNEEELKYKSDYLYEEKLNHDTILIQS